MEFAKASMAEKFIVLHFVHEGKDFRLPLAYVHEAQNGKQIPLFKMKNHNEGISQSEADILLAAGIALTQTPEINDAIIELDNYYGESDFQRAIASLFVLFNSHAAKT